MGRNGAGKSTLLRVAAGLAEPSRGKVRRAGRVGLLLQNPGDYTLRDRVGDELPAEALAAAGLQALAGRHPRDISGGERQRLALAIVLHGERPAVVCLDEPTRGMDRGHKDALAALLGRLADAGTAVIVATHDAEFAAAFAARTVLLGDGRPVADAPTAEVLAGGWYFATQTARILGGAALLPEDGAALLRRDALRRRDVAHRARAARVSWIGSPSLRCVLGLALAAGFGWYERSHPSARVLALVATLAALAALGRIAFAPLPSVKPTTDIVLLCGYVLGGAPGFAVGAVAALASNLFFGQGPWTPWQMVGWGGAGLFGAALAQLGGRELGRLALATACAAAGLAFGAVMNLSLWVTYSGDHTLAKLGTVFATSLPFDVAHALGNAAFCLAFGPALVRALRRYRSRFEVTWRPAPAAAGVAVALLALVASLQALPPDASAAVPAKSVAYLERAQNADGGLGPAPGDGLDADAHGLGRAGAGGRRPQPARRRARRKRHRRLHPRPRRRAQGRPGRALAHDPRAPRGGRLAARVGGRDLLGELLRAQEDDGSFAGRVNTTAFAILALRAAGRPADDRAIRAGAALHREPGERRRRLQLRRQGRRLRRRRHRRGAAGARGRRAPPFAGRPARGRLARAPPEPRRRLRAPERFQQRPVDGLGRAGPDRGGPRSGAGAPRRLALAARLPALARHRERGDPLLAHERADAGLGDGAGADRARPQAVPAAPGAARAADDRGRARPGADRAAQRRRPRRLRSAKRAEKRKPQPDDEGPDDHDQPADPDRRPPRRRGAARRPPTRPARATSPRCSRARCSPA